MGMTITVGPFRWEHALLNVIDLTTVNGDDHYSSANGGLGAGFLQHFRVTLDGQEGRVWLKQSTPFGTHEGDCALRPCAMDVGGFTHGPRRGSGWAPPPAPA